MDLFPLPVMVVMVAVLVAALTDLRLFKIHNLLTLPLIVSGVAWHSATGGYEGLTDSILGTLTGFGLPLLLFLVGGMGGGDVKLLAGVGAWLGAPLTVLIFLAACLATGVYSLAVIVASGRVRETLVKFQIMWYRVSALGRNLAADDHVEVVAQRSDRRGRLVPFGAMMGVGLVALIAVARLRPTP